LDLAAVMGLPDLAGGPSSVLVLVAAAERDVPGGTDQLAVGIEGISLGVGRRPHGRLDGDRLAILGISLVAG
jgi:hypothetical protein